MPPAAVWSDFDAGDRCIQHAKAGPPISTGGYNNNIQIFQTPDHVVILAEQNHNARIVPLDGRPHVAPGIRQVSLNGGLFPTTDEPEGRPGHVY